MSKRRGTVKIEGVPPPKISGMSVDQVWTDEVEEQTDMDMLDRDGEPINEESPAAMTPIKQIVIICGLIFVQDWADKMSFQGSLVDKDSVSGMASALRAYHKVPVHVIHEDEMPQLLEAAGFGKANS